MKHFIRIAYKAIQYGMMLCRAIFFTTVFRSLLKINGVKYGKGVQCFNAIPALQINRHSLLVSIGDQVIFNSYTDHSWNAKCKLIVLAGAVLTVGSNSGMNGVMLYCSKEVRIGSHVKIGGGTKISDSNHHSLDYLTRRNAASDSQEAESSPIHIGNDVFIGAGCYIGKGVTIGNRSIVAAGSVVVKSIPADEIWGGNPARFIKKINITSKP